MYGGVTVRIRPVARGGGIWTSNGWVPHIHLAATHTFNGEGERVMETYQLKTACVVTAKDELGGEHEIEFAEAEIQVKTWVSAPYGYGSSDWRAETLRVWIHVASGALTVDPEKFVGTRHVKTRYEKP